MMTITFPLWSPQPSGGMDMQVNFVIGYAFFLSDFIANEGIGPSDSFAPDFVVGFSSHLIPEAFRLLRGTAVQELFEVSDAPRPKHRLDRGFGCGVAGKGEGRGPGLCFGALYCDGSGAGGNDGNRAHDNRGFEFGPCHNFSVVLMRVKVKVVTAVPLTAAAVTDVASPIGAA